MIYIKTNLKKLPDRCNKCKYSEFIHSWKWYKNGKYERCYPEDRYCTLLNERCPKVLNEQKKWTYSKLKECPLINVEK